MNWSIPVWLVIVFALYLVGFYEGRRKGYKIREAEEAKEKRENPPTPHAPATIKVDDPGLLRIKNESGFLTLDLDGTRVDTSSMTTDQRKRLIEMLNVIRPWLEGKPAPAPATMSSTAVQPQPKPVPQPQISSSPKPTPPVPPSRPSAPSRDEHPPAAAPLGIVGQIDTILQARLIGTPLEGRGISLSQSPEGGVMVYVGVQKFMAIDDVPHPEIKAAIRAAITEWENKYTPGM